MTTCGNVYLLIDQLVPFGIQNNTLKYWVWKIIPRGTCRRPKIFGRSPLYEKKYFGVQGRVIHGWKGLWEWNNFKKACWGLKLIVKLVSKKMCEIFVYFAYHIVYIYSVYFHACMVNIGVRGFKNNTYLNYQLKYFTNKQKTKQSFFQ